MCGIAGFADFKKSSSEEILKSMTNTLKHRGPDGDGYYFKENAYAQIGLGHRRLSIIDLSECGSQQMHYNGLHIIFNGEVYNFAEIREDLEQKGHQFVGHADTEIIVHAYAEWGIDAEAVEWLDGAAVPAGPNAGKFPPMSIAEIAAKMGSTGGPISGHHEVTAGGVGASFGAHVVDVEVDTETGRTTVLRYLVVQDAGRAIHPAYVEGQYQGGAVQGIGWALNEEYVYGADGRLQNAVFLDYRIPVASDLPMIDTVIVEVPNPGHPYGVRGVGETGITPPLPALANAIAAATGARLRSLPMSPPKVLAAIKANARG